MVLGATLLIASCGRDPVLGPRADPEIVVGSGNTAPGQVMADILTDGLARGGFPVATSAVGDRAAALAALDDNSVTLVSGLTGDLLRYFNPKAPQGKPKQECESLSRALPADLAVSDCTEAQWSLADVTGEEDDAAPARTIVALYRAGALNDRQQRRLNLVLGTLTQADVVTVRTAVERGRPPAEVAREWLDSRNL
jgi:glycine betaine/choline ABC-type transport system substrate-binding protein